MTASYVTPGRSSYCRDKPEAPAQNVKERLSFDDKGRLAVQRNYSIDKNGSSVFVQNAELHTHGFNAADLGLGVYRNAVMINSILGYEYYQIEDGISFQNFSSLK